MLFNPGDIVKCKVGGPEMVISVIGQYPIPGGNGETYRICTCLWWNAGINGLGAGIFSQHNFPETSLVKVE